MELRYYQTISVWLNCCRSFDNLQNKQNQCFTNFSFINFTAYIHVTYKKVCISWTFVVILKITNQCCSYIYNIKLFFSFWMSHEGTYKFFKKAEVVCLIECATRVFFFHLRFKILESNDFPFDTIYNPTKRIIILWQRITQIDITISFFLYMKTPIHLQGFYP